MLERMKTDVDRLLLVSKFRKSSSLAKYIGNFFPFSKPKVVYVRPFSSSLTFQKFWKQRFVYFGHKHLETGPNYSYELATLLKYHMPLKLIILIIDQINYISRNRVKGNEILHLVT